MGRAVLSRNGYPLFPLGFYERPRDEAEWKAWSEAGINLVCCHNREHLDMAREYGMFAWVPVPMIVADDEGERKLREVVESLRDHPAIAVWEAPDEAIWRTLYFGDDRARWLWKESPERAAEVLRRRDELVLGLERGSRIIRELDPTRNLWLNEATSSDFETLARCLPHLDIVGFDFYPVPSTEGQPLSTWGPMMDRYVRVAPHHEQWAVQQAFSWSSLSGRHGEGKKPAYPTLEEARFVAWQAIMHGATGILWWGSSHEERPAMFLDGIMQVAGELNRVQPFLVGGRAHGVRVEVDLQTRPGVLGVSGGAYRNGDATILVLVCEDKSGHEVILRGFDGNLNEMEQITPASSEFVRTKDGWVTLMDGYEVRVYVTK